MQCCELFFLYFTVHYSSSYTSVCFSTSASKCTAVAVCSCVLLLSCDLHPGLLEHTSVLLWQCVNLSFCNCTSVCVHVMGHWVCCCKSKSMYTAFYKCPIVLLYSHIYVQKLTLNHQCSHLYFCTNNSTSFQCYNNILMCIAFYVELQ